MQTSDEKRRSERDPNVAYLNKADIQILLEKIKTNHEDTVVLKFKDHLPANINSFALSTIIKAMYNNRVCQAIYAQNLTQAMKDEQLKEMIKLLKKKKIWCLNLGENYDVTLAGWKYFCSELPKTHVTHLYVSEHTIPLKLKNEMRFHIRENRKKHDRHKSLKNLKVIVRCTNMWWNPINAIRHQLEAQAVESAASDLGLSAQKITKRLKVSEIDWGPDSTVYWAQGLGKGGETAWSFSCRCGEKCSSYENYRYHPTGQMFECTSCKVWGHSNCYFSGIAPEVIEEIEALCFKCHTQQRRRQLYELRQMHVRFADGGIAFVDISDSNTVSNSNSSSSSTGNTSAGDVSSHEDLEDNNIECDNDEDMNNEISCDANDVIGLVYECEIDKFTGCHICRQTDAEECDT